MANETEYDIDIKVSGTPTIRDAANALAGINQNLKDMARSLSSAIKALDKTEQSFAGVRRGKKDIDSLTQAAQKYYKVIDTNKGKSVTLQEVAKAPASRGANGQFVSSSISNNAADKATIHNQQQIQNALKQSQRRYYEAAFASDKYSDSTVKTAKNLRGFHQMLQENNRELPQLRYSLYSVAASLGIVGAALIAVNAATLKTAVDYEKRFAEVRRTTGVTGAAAEQLRQNLIELQQTLPISNEQINQIAALAGQLGIAEDRVTSFTSTVAKFAATSNVDVDQAATAFGRLDSLLPGVQGNYEGLASSILEVGINSVATESQIISISSQIAAAGAQSGLTADEVIGLSAAFASLGVAPESARGTVLRVFSEINSAIAGGGEELEQFANVAGITASEFEDKWTNGGFTEVFTEFLAGIGSKGVQAETALNQLGITATRDVNSMLKLAQNSGDVAEYLGLSAEGFESNTRLGASFGIIADTTSAKLQVLSQSFEALVATLGEGVAGTPLNELASGITDLVNGIQNLLSNPVGQWIAGLTIVVSTLVGVLSLLGAGIAASAAGFLAFETLAGSATVATLGLTGAVTALGTAMKVALIGTGIGAAVVILGSIAAAIYEVATASEQADTAVQDYFGDLSSLTAAIKADNIAGKSSAQNYATVQANVVKSSQAVESWQTKLESSAGAQVHVAEGLETTNSKLVTQTFNLAENTKAWFSNSLANDENIQNLFKNADALAAYGFSGQTLIEKIVGDPDGSDAAAYIAGLKDTVIAPLQAELDKIDSSGAFDQNTVNRAAKLNEQIRNVTDAFAPAEKAQKAYGKSAKAAADQIALEDSINKALGISTNEVSDETSAASDENKSLVESIFSAINAQYALQTSLQGLGQTYAEAGASSYEFQTALGGVVENILATAPSSAAAASSILGFYNALLAGGYASVAQLALVKQAIDSLSGGAEVVAQKFDLTNFVGGLKEAGSAAGGAGKAIGGVAKEIRTLVDYANDLKGVLSRAFDIRNGVSDAKDAITEATRQIQEDFAEADKDVIKFKRTLAEAKAEAKNAFSTTYAEAFVDALSNGMSEVFDKAFAGKDAQDELASTFYDLADAIDESKLALQELQAQMQDNSASLAVKQFQLGVAEQYGDTLAIGTLTADIAELQAKRADLSNQISDENDKQSRETEGNSKAALANRDTIRGLVGQYKDYIDVLAQTGATTDQISAAVQQTKADFIAQGKALGFTDAQLAQYAAAFDGFGGANTSAAAQANIAATQAQAEADEAVAQAKDDLADATGRASRALDGNSAAAIRNRKNLRDLESKVNDYATAMAGAGLSTGAINSKLDTLEGKLSTQLSSMGLTKINGVDPLTTAFDNLKLAMDKVPRDVNVAFSGDAAQQAINEFIKKNSGGSGASKGVTVPVKLVPDDPAGDGALAAEKFSRAFRQKLENGHIKIVLKDGSFYIQGNPDVIGKARGGLIKGPGTATSDSIPIMASDNEYMIKASSANALGTPVLDYLNKYGQLPTYASAGGSAASSGSGFMTGVVELGPKSMGVLRDAVSKEVSVILGDADIAKSANRGNKQLAYQGK
jgi:TP901 family phage tail tape measure protein